MKKRDHDLEKTVRDALRGKNVPILVLDQRWHTLFPKGEKPSDVRSLEDQVSDLLKRQGFLVNDLKDLKKTKRKLMAGIVSRMSDVENADKKKKNQQRLLVEMQERIKEESDELMELPRRIQKANEELLIVGAVYCFEKLENGDRELDELNRDIVQLTGELKEKTAYKEDLEESMDSAYALMHGILGHDVMNVYDHRKG
jgi:DNA repair exonuclease SbcCD ATPase subunit